MKSLTSIVVPVYNEGETATAHLTDIAESVSSPFEVLVVHDTPDDSTVPAVENLRQSHPEILPVLNTYGRGPANAIRFGMDSAEGDVVVVTMSDGSDDPVLIDEMVSLVRAGHAVVAASRYMRGGRQLGGPFIKRVLSRVAGISLYYLGRVGTHDATNSFKAYSAEFLRSVSMESSNGFEIGIELVAKARRRRQPVAEIPTTWTDRTDGESRFRVAAWIPHYFKWYLFALGRPKQGSADVAVRETS